MKPKHHKLTLALSVSLSLSFLALVLLIILCCRKRKSKNETTDSGSGKEGEDLSNGPDCFLKFQKWDGLTVQEILESPGEVIEKSSYGTLYRASLVNLRSIALVRLLKRHCTLPTKEALAIASFFGSINHPNLVPLTAFYAGPIGETLMVHPYYRFGNLAQLIKDVNKGTDLKWPLIHKISIGITRGLHHLHTSFGKPLIHGNLSSKNVFFDHHFNPYISEFGLHILLNPTAGQQMLEASASHGYTAPELIKIRDVDERSDIYNLGLIFLELLSGKIWAEQAFNSQESYSFGNQIPGFFHPNILLGLSGDQKVDTENRALKFFKLAIACCSPSSMARPDTFRVLEKLEEIGE